MKVSVSLLDRVQASGSTQSGRYYPNRAPLQRCPFQRLPPSSIQPAGWLKVQLQMQLTGLNGRLFEKSDFLNYDECGWVHPKKFGWEELPYWLRGYADLAFLTGDVDALRLTRQWIDAILNSQQANGWFGPDRLRQSLDGEPDLWPAMLVIDALRSYYEYSSDARVLPFLLKYFQFVSAQSNKVFTLGWGYTRWADNIDSLIWLYNRTTDTDWLLDLIQRIHSNAANWMTGLPTRHNVNLSQGFREPALYSLLVNPPDPRYLQATYNIFQTIINEFGQFAGGGFAGDENCRGGFGDPRQGFETCGIVELMHTCSILARLTGDGMWANRCETLAFNSLPAALDPFRARSTHYITSANSIQLDKHLKTQKQFQNLFPMLAYMPGIYLYRCCAHNYGFGWPYFTEELWLATWDDGLCASMYAPCQVTAFVGEGQAVAVTIVEETDYPFGDTINFHFRLAAPTQFKLYLRIPQWCEEPVILIQNGQTTFNSTVGGSFIVIDQTWNNDDRLLLTFDRHIRTKTWFSNQNSVSLNYGPLSFSLNIDEQWKRVGGEEDWPEYEVLPKSPWNYGLIVTNPSEWIVRYDKEKSKDDINPFTPATAPLSIEVRARRIPSWKADDENVVGLLPTSSVAGEGPEETIKLIPMGAARLRITSFPAISQ